MQDVVRAWASAYADEVRTDRHGNVIAVLHPEKQPRIMLAVGRTPNTAGIPGRRFS